MKMEFESPSIVVVAHIGPLTNEEIAALPEDKFAAYLKEYGYDEAKQAALAAKDK